MFGERNARIVDQTVSNEMGKLSAKLGGISFSLNEKKRSGGYLNTRCCQLTEINKMPGDCRASYYTFYFIIPISNTFIK